MNLRRYIKYRHNVLSCTDFDNFLSFHSDNLTVNCKIDINTNHNSIAILPLFSLINALLKQIAAFHLQVLSLLSRKQPNKMLATFIYFD